MADDRVEIQITGDAGPLSAALQQAQKDVAAFQGAAALAGTGVAEADKKIEEAANKATKSVHDLYVEAQKAQKLSSDQVQQIGDVSKRFGEAATQAAGGVTKVSDASNILAQKLGGLGAASLVVHENLKALTEQMDKAGKVALNLAPPELRENLKGLGLIIDSIAHPTRILSNIFEGFDNAFKQYAEGMEGVVAADQKAAGATNDLVAAKQKELVALRGFAASIDDQIAKRKEESDQLLKYVEVQLKFGQLTGERLAVVKDQIGSVIESYTSLGVEAPKALKWLADELGVTIGLHEQHAKSAEDASVRVVAALNKEAEAAQANYDKALAAENALKAKTGGGGDTAANADKLKAKVKELEGLTYQTPEQMAELDALKTQLSDVNFQLTKGFGNLGDFSSSMNAWAQSSHSANAEQSALAEATARTNNASIDLAIAQQKQADTTQEAGAQASGAAVHVEKMADGTTRLSNVADDAAISVTKAADGTTKLSKGADGVKRLTNETDKAAASFEDVKGGVSTAADAMAEKLKPAVTEVNDQLAIMKGLLIENVALFGQIGGA